MIHQLIRFISCIAILSFSLAHSNDLLDYLEPYPYYSSDEAISPRLIELLRKQLPMSDVLMLRGAALLVHRFDATYNHTYTNKENNEVTDKKRGPQRDGFLMVVRLIANPAASEHHTNLVRHEKIQIDLPSNAPDHAARCLHAVIPTEDLRFYYSLDIEIGGDIPDSTMTSLAQTVAAYAKNDK